MGNIRDVLELEERDVPDYTTLNKSFDRFKMWVWRALLRVSIEGESVDIAFGQQSVTVEPHDDRCRGGNDSQNQPATRVSVIAGFNPRSSPLCWTSRL